MIELLAEGERMDIDIQKVNHRVHTHNTKDRV